MKTRYFCFRSIQNALNLSTPKNRIHPLSVWGQTKHCIQPKKIKYYFQCTVLASNTKIYVTEAKQLHLKGLQSACKCMASSRMHQSENVGFSASSNVRAGMRQEHTSHLLLTWDCSLLLLEVLHPQTESLFAMIAPFWAPFGQGDHRSQWEPM